MKTRMILPLLFFLLAQAYAQAPYESSVFVPRQPLPGEEISLEYDAKGGDLEFSDEVSVALYVFGRRGWRTEKLQMAKSSGKWQARYQLGDDAVFLAARFFQGALERPDAWDNKGYAVPVFSNSGEPRTGAYLAEAAFLAPKASGQVPLYYYAEQPAIDRAGIKDLLDKEDSLSPEAVRRHFATYMNLRSAQLGDAFADYAATTVAAILKSDKLQEQTLDDMYSYLAFKLKDSLLARQVEQRIQEEYPRGGAARAVAFHRLEQGGADIASATKAYEAFLNRFPIAEWRRHPDSKGYMYYTVYRMLGAAYFDTKQFDKFSALYEGDALDFRTGNELMRWNIMRAYMFKTLGQDTLYQISATILPKLIAKKNDGSYIGDFRSRAFADSNMNKQLDERLFTHISLLNDLGKYEEARKYFFELSEAGRYTNAELNEINLHVLEGLELDNEILPLLEMSAKFNAVTPKMFDKLKQLYVAQHGGSDAGYEDYLASLKSDEEKRAVQDYIKKHLVNHPMPSFQLENAEGGSVRLEDWKDKIVVVDFWATWCRPCIMAFPGMQLLVDKYASDPGVEIYMVGTMQFDNYREKSVGFVKSEGYRFQLLHDGIDPKTDSQNLVFRQLIPAVFEDSSIPRKIVLKDGIIRYASGGYSGSPSKLLDELSSVIEMLKNEK